MVWCIPAYASVSHMNCSCCSLPKSCCEDLEDKTVQIEKQDISCPECKCNISEKGTAENTFLTAKTATQNNDNTLTYIIDTQAKLFKSKTDLILSSHTPPLKLLPLFMKNSVYLL